jgi:hypothetical protein
VANRALVRRIGAFALAAIVCIALFFAGYRHVPNRAERARASGAMLWWMVRVLAYPMLETTVSLPELALAIALWACVALAMVRYWRARRSPAARARLMLFAGLGLVLLANAAVTGYGRGGTPIVPSRYGTLLLLDSVLWLVAVADLMRGAGGAAEPRTGVRAGALRPRRGPAARARQPLSRRSDHHAAPASEPRGRCAKRWPTTCPITRPTCRFRASDLPAARAAAGRPRAPRAARGAAARDVAVVDGVAGHDPGATPGRRTARSRTSRPTGRGGARSTAGPRCRRRPRPGARRAAAPPAVGRIRVGPIAIHDPVLRIPIAGYPGTPDTALTIQDATDTRHRLQYAGGPPGDVWSNWDADVSSFVGRDVYLFGVDNARQPPGWFAFGRPRPMSRALWRFDLTLSRAGLALQILVLASVGVLLAMAHRRRGAGRHGEQPAGATAPAPSRSDRRVGARARLAEEP